MTSTCDNHIWQLTSVEPTLSGRGRWPETLPVWDSAWAHPCFRARLCSVPFPSLSATWSLCREHAHQCRHLSHDQQHLNSIRIKVVIQLVQIVPCYVSRASVDGRSKTDQASGWLSVVGMSDMSCLQCFDTYLGKDTQRIKILHKSSRKPSFGGSGPT